MAAESPIVPSDLGAITGGLLACDHLRELLNTRTKMQDFVAWQVDESGNLTSDFKNAFIQQLLFDAAKLGWFVRTSPTTGYLELVQYVALAGLDIAGAAAGDYIVFNGTNWVKQTPVYAAPTAGGTTIPAANAGGILTVAHGLSAIPKQRECHLICNAADANYAVGDILNGASLSQMGSGGEVRGAITIGADATNVFAVFMADGSNPKNYMLPDKSAFTLANIDPSKWSVFLYAMP